VAMDEMRVMARVMGELCYWKARILARHRNAICLFGLDAIVGAWKNRSKPHHPSPRWLKPPRIG
jgi:hypothetical protein